MGGIFNTVNTNYYHYAGNNPVKYFDPYMNNSKTYTLDDIKGIYLIQEQD